MSGRFLTLMTLSRVGAASLTMVYAGSLPFLLQPWGMTSSQAGAIQAAANLTYAVSLLVCSWLSDRVGPQQIFAWANRLAAALFCATALFARSFESGLLWFSLLAAALGGSYTPALMLVARAIPAHRRGRAVGLVIGGASVGYFGAIAACAGLVPLLGHERAWLLMSAPAVLAALAGSAAVKAMPNATGESAPAQLLSPAASRRRGRLLTAGYTAHCWELLGMWAWGPAFLALSLSQSTALSPALLAALAGAALHLSGAAATLAGGALSDHVGRKRVLVGMAAGGAALSFVFGWSEQFGPVVLLVVAVLYGFATVGDSSVLSTAMTEATPPGQLGRMLAVRSILGFGAGALSPIAMGWVLDLTNPAGGPPEHWGLAFALLGLGGLAAMLCAAGLPADAPQGAEGQLKFRDLRRRARRWR